MLTSSLDNHNLIPQEVERFPLQQDTTVVTGPPASPRFVVRPESAESRKNAVTEFENEVGSPGTGIVPALVGNAEVLAQHKERDLALVLLRQALAEDSFHVSSLRRIYDLLSAGEWTLAERTSIAETLSATTKMASDTLRLAKLEYEKGNLERSLEYYFEAASRIQEEDRTVFEIYKDIGNIFVRQGDFDGAEEYYHKAFALDPDSDALHVNLGTLEIQRQDWGGARDRFRFALGLNPRSDKAWVGLALAHYQLGDIDLAFANVGKAIDLNRANRTAVLLLANWGEKHGRVDEAVDALQDFLGEVSFDEDISLALIQLFCTQKNYVFAQFEIDRVLLWNPLRTDLYELSEKIQMIAESEKPVIKPVREPGGELFG